MNERNRALPFLRRAFNLDESAIHDAISRFSRKASDGANFISQFYNLFPLQAPWKIIYWTRSRDRDGQPIWGQVGDRGADTVGVAVSCTRRTRLEENQQTDRQLKSDSMRRRCLLLIDSTSERTTTTIRYLFRGRSAEALSGLAAAAAGHKICSLQQSTLPPRRSRSLFVTNVFLRLK